MQHAACNIRPALRSSHVKSVAGPIEPPKGTHLDACMCSRLARSRSLSGARARQRVGAACVRLGVPAVMELVSRAYVDLDGKYAFHGDIRRGIEGGDAKLLRALRQVDAARVAGNEAFVKGAHSEAALAYTAGLTPDPYNPYGDNRTADGRDQAS